jgi:hypothetical protein
MDGSSVTVSPSSIDSRTLGTIASLGAAVGAMVVGMIRLRVFNHGFSHGFREGNHQQYCFSKP